MSSRVLAGDIGGTKTLLCLAQVCGGRLRIIAQKRYASRRFSRFGEVLGDFLGDHPESLAAACFGVAGPVEGNLCRTTNLPWFLDAATLSPQIGAEVLLLNDLEAAAHGILQLPPEQFVDLNPGARPRRTHRAVIAAGTGLGEALIVQGKADVTVVATEGGHCDFAPRDEVEDGLLAWLRRSHPEHVSYERVLSGSGLAEIYRFLRARAPERESGEVATALAREDPAAVVGTWGLRGDPLCREALRRFAVIYGAEAGNLVLKSLALGGVYVAGGIAPKILPVLQEGGFLQGFRGKGRYAALLQGVPVQVVRFTGVVLLGTLHWACVHLLRGPAVNVYNGLLESDENAQGETG